MRWQAIAHVTAPLATRNCCSVDTVCTIAGFICETNREETIEAAAPVSTMAPKTLLLQRIRRMMGGNDRWKELCFLSPGPFFSRRSSGAPHCGFCHPHRCLPQRWQVESRH